MKKMLLSLIFILSFIILFPVNTYAHAEEFQSGTYVGSVYFTFDEPIIGEKPCKTVKVRSGPSNVVKKSEINVIWVEINKNNNKRTMSSNDVFKEGYKYYFNWNENIFEDGYEVSQIDWYYNNIKLTENYYITPLKRVYDNTSNGIVKIKELKLIEKSDNVELTEAPSYKDLDLSLGFRLENVNDYVKYKVVIRNDDKEDYEISNSSKKNDSEYIKYEYTFEDNSNIIKANSEKTMYITVKYIKQVPDNLLTNGKYSENNNITIKLENDKNNIITNPKTGLPILLISIVLISSVIVSILIKNKKTRNSLIAIIFFVGISIPTVTYALKIISINVNSKVEIVKTQEFCAYIGNHGTCEDINYNDYTKVNYKYAVGSTLEDIINEGKINIGYSHSIEMPTNRVTINFIDNNSNVSIVNYTDKIKDKSQGCYDFIKYVGCEG